MPSYCVSTRGISTRALLAVVFAAGGSLGMAGQASAQDSTAPTNGLPGDAVNAYGVSPSRQVLNFVVDLTPKSSSWLNKYAVGPAVKASKSNAGGYFDLLMASQAVSNRFSTGPLFQTGAYSLWNAAGQGANPDSNTTPASSVTGASHVGQQFGVAFLEYGSGQDGLLGDGDDENNIIGSIINFQYRNPNRLLVSRIVGLVNKTSASANGTASFGLGGVDEAGNIHVYGDSFGMTVPQRLSQRELIRSKLSLRNAANLPTVAQSGTGDPSATDTVRVTTTSMTVPGIISSNVTGGSGRPVMLASDFASNYVYESGINTTTTTMSYLPGSAGSPRGSVSFVPQVYGPVNTSGTDVGTVGTLVRTNSNTQTRGLQIFGVKSTGAPDGQTQITLPTTASAMVDPTDNFTPGTTFSPITAHEFTNYASQASFRGGASQVAMTVLSGGDLLVAALVSETGGGSTVPQGQDNYLAVARVPAAGGTPNWLVAAHTGNSQGSAGGLSKAILGRSVTNGPLTTIGRLARYTEVYGSASTGPSISSPALDRAGNIYFMATIALNNGSGGTTFSTGLLRGNYISATGGYQLELITSLGDVYAGQNSATNYQIQFMGVADADSVDSGTIFSGNIVQDVAAGVNLATKPYGSPFTLGALVFHAKIVYDVNGDGVYADPSGAGAGSTSPDQAYNVAMVVMPQIKPGDFNRDGAKTVQDIFDFLTAWFAGNGDYNGSGATTIQDIFDFLGDWFAM